MDLSKRWNDIILIYSKTSYMSRDGFRLGILFFIKSLGMVLGYFSILAYSFEYLAPKC